MHASYGSPRRQSAPVHAPATGARWEPQPQQAALYEQMWEYALTRGLNAGKPAVDFLSTCGLPRDMLRYIWALCDPQGRGFVERPAFLAAMRLISLAQHRLEVSLPALDATAMAPLPPPQLGALQEFMLAWMASQQAVSAPSPAAAGPPQPKQRDPFATLSNLSPRKQPAGVDADDDFGEFTAAKPSLNGHSGAGAAFAVAAAAAEAQGGDNDDFGDFASASHAPSPQRAAAAAAAMHFSSPRRASAPTGLFPVQAPPRIEDLMDRNLDLSGKHVPKLGEMASQSPRHFSPGSPGPHNANGSVTSVSGPFGSPAGSGAANGSLRDSFGSPSSAGTAAAAAAAAAHAAAAMVDRSREVHDRLGVFDELALEQAAEQEEWDDFQDVGSSSATKEGAAAAESAATAAAAAAATAAAAEHGDRGSGAGVNPVFSSAVAAGLAVSHASQPGPSARQATNPFDELLASESDGAAAADAHERSTSLGAAAAAEDQDSLWADASAQGEPLPPLPPPPPQQEAPHVHSFRVEVDDVDSNEEDDDDWGDFSSSGAPAQTAAAADAAGPPLAEEEMPPQTPSRASGVLPVGDGNAGGSMRLGMSPPRPVQPDSEGLFPEDDPFADLPVPGEGNASDAPAAVASTSSAPATPFGGSDFGEFEGAPLEVGDAGNEAAAFALSASAAGDDAFASDPFADAVEGEAAAKAATDASLEEGGTAAADGGDATAAVQAADAAVAESPEEPAAPADPFAELLSPGGGGASKPRLASSASTGAPAPDTTDAAAAAPAASPNGGPASVTTAASEILAHRCATAPLADALGLLVAANRLEEACQLEMHLKERSETAVDPETEKRWRQAAQEPLPSLLALAAEVASLANSSGEGEARSWVFRERFVNGKPSLTGEASAPAGLARALQRQREAQRCLQVARELVLPDLFERWRSLVTAATALVAAGADRLQGMAALNPAADAEAAQARSELSEAPKVARYIQALAAALGVARMVAASAEDGLTSIDLSEVESAWEAVVTAAAALGGAAAEAAKGAPPLSVQELRALAVTVAAGSPLCCLSLLPLDAVSAQLPATAYYGTRYIAPCANLWLNCVSTDLPGTERGSDYW